MTSIESGVLPCPLWYSIRLSSLHRVPGKTRSLKDYNLVLNQGSFDAPKATVRQLQVEPFVKLIRVVNLENLPKMMQSASLFRWPAPWELSYFCLLQSVVRASGRDFRLFGTSSTGRLIQRISHMVWIRLLETGFKFVLHSNSLWARNCQWSHQNLWINLSNDALCS